MTGMLFAAIVLSILLVSVGGWLLSARMASIIAARVGPQRSRVLFAATGAAVIAVAGLATWWYAERARKAVPALVEAPAATNTPVAGPAVTPLQGGDLTVLVGRLEARLARETEDAQGWALFARTQMELRRFDGAAAAYARAVSLLPADADLHAERADAEYMANDRKWTAAATAALSTALKLKPDHLEALWLSGSERFDARDFTGAIRHWEKLARLAPADSEYAKQMKTALAEARALRDGTDPAAAVAALPASAADGKAQLIAELRAATGPAPSAPVSPAAAGGTGVLRGEIRLDPALRSRVSADDTLFVFAREAGAAASTMPLAARRYRAADLPVLFELSDNDAMSTANRLSAAKALIVTARITKTGGVGAQPGDLESVSGPVPPGTTNISVHIRNVR